MTATLAGPDINAVPVFPPVRGRRQRERWLARRADGIGSSDIAAVLGESSYASPFSLFWTKTEGWSSDRQTEEQEWGHRLEVVVAKKFAEETRMRVAAPPASMYAHRRYWWALCSPDRLVTHRTEPDVWAPLELKTDENFGRWDRETMPEPYRLQLAWQCAVLGVNTGFLAALVGKRFFSYRVEFHSDELEELLTAGERFWGAVMAGDCPPVDGATATSRTLQRLNGLDPEAEPVALPTRLVDEYETKWAAAKAAGEQLKDVENRVRSAMGASGRAYDPRTGDPVLTRSVYTRNGYVVAPSVVDQLRRPQTRKKSQDA